MNIKKKSYVSSWYPAPNLIKICMILEKIVIVIHLEKIIIIYNLESGLHDRELQFLHTNGLVLVHRSFQVILFHLLKLLLLINFYSIHALRSTNKVFSF